jgi:site-specific DNA recombinase
MRAVTYCRFSTDLQRQASIEDQHRICLARIERERWRVVSRFKDEALSGARADRPGYVALMEAAKRREFDVIVCEEVSRLWRDQEEQWRAVKRLEYWGVQIVGCNDGIDTRAGYGLLLGIRGALNEEARREIGKRTHRGLAGVALNGHNAGGRSYGYRHVPIEDPSRKDHLGRPVVVAVKREIDPEQARQVRRIFKLFVDGYSPRQIADKLNALGVPSPGATWNRRTRQCRGWSGSAIYGDLRRGFGILCNPLYAGLYIWNRTRRQVDPDTKSRKHAPRPREEWVIQEAPGLRIVPRELWDAAQARLQAQRKQSAVIREAMHDRARTGRGPKYLFSGLLKCGTCGGNFIIVNAMQYGCATHKDRGPSVCGNDMKVARRLVETLLLEAVRRDLFTDETIKLFKIETSRLLAEQRRKPNGADAARDRLVEVEREIDNLLAAIKAGIITQTTKGELERLEAERDRLTASLSADVRKLDKVGHMLPRAVERFRDLVDGLEAVTLRDVTRARAELRRLIGDVPLHPRDGYLEAELKGKYAGVLRLAQVELGSRNNCGTEERT